MKRSNCLSAITLAFALAVWGAWSPDARAQNNDDLANEYRLTLFPYHKIDDHWTGFGYLGYVVNPDKDTKTYYLGYGANYSFNRSVQMWGGLFGTYTDNQNNSDKLELRPFVGAKLFLPNEIKWNVYNFTRLEYRDIQDRDTDDWTGSFRLRSRFGFECPMTSFDKAWQPKTWYGLADVEAFYRFDKDTLDPLRARAGIAYVASSRIRVERIYHAQYTRPTGSSGLEYTDNIYLLNIKIAMNKGILQRVFDGGDSDD